MKLVLTPYWIAEECFLQEALMWAAFYRYPKSEIIPDRVDIRFDRDAQEEFEPNVPDWHGYIESEDAIRAGLPPNPEWEALLDDETYTLSSTNSIKSLLELDLDRTEKANLKKELAKAEAQEKEKDQAEWNKKYKAHIELLESKLFIALREGTIKAYGRKLPHPDLDIATEMLNSKEGYWSIFDMEHEDVPASFWRFDSISWMDSMAKNDESHYFHIYVNTEELMNVFPAPNAEEAKGVSLIAGQYILNESNTRKIKKASNRGRPSLDWDSFYLELTDRIQNNRLPDKQEAFIADMQAWCLENWKQEVGRSTILQKVSPFFKKYAPK